MTTENEYESWCWTKWIILKVIFWFETIDVLMRICVAPGQTRFQFLCVFVSLVGWNNSMELAKLYILHANFGVVKYVVAFIFRLTTFGNLLIQCEADGFARSLDFLNIFFVLGGAKSTKLCLHMNGWMPWKDTRDDVMRAHIRLTSISIGSIDNWMRPKSSARKTKYLFSWSKPQPNKIKNRISSTETALLSSNALELFGQLRCGVHNTRTYERTHDNNNNNQRNADLFSISNKSR